MPVFLVKYMKLQGCLKMIVYACKGAAKSYVVKEGAVKMIRLKTTALVKCFYTL